MLYFTSRRRTLVDNINNTILKMSYTLIAYLCIKIRYTCYKIASTAANKQMYRLIL